MIQDSTTFQLYKQAVYCIIPNLTENSNQCSHYFHISRPKFFFAYSMLHDSVSEHSSALYHFLIIWTFVTCFYEHEFENMKYQRDF